MKNRRALVTGASRGIGAAIARQLAASGAQVAIVARRADGLGVVVDGIREEGGVAHAIPMDLTPWSAAEDIVTRATEALGGAPEILCMSHGGMIPPRKVHMAEEGEVDDALASDLRSPMAIIGAASPHMMRAKYGRIVLIGSVLGRLGQPGSVINSVVKAGLEGLARNVAADLGRFGITANLVAPGFVDTERQQDRGAGEDALKAMAQASAIRRLVRPEDVAAMVGFLASAASAGVTGAVIDVDGGMHVAHALRRR